MKMGIFEFWIHKIRAAGVCTFLKPPEPERSEKLNIKSWWTEKDEEALALALILGKDGLLS